MSTETTQVEGTQAVTPAPVAAPPAKEETTQAPAVAEATQEFTYESTGYANADYALGVIGKAGIGPEHPAVVAAYDGDFGQLEHLLASKDVPGATALLAMLKDASDKHSASQKEVGEKIANSIYELAGSKENWQAVQAWGAENADDDEKELLNEMFADPRQSKIAAVYLMSMYDKAQVPHEPQTSVTGARPAVAAAATPAAGPIDRKEFAAQAQALYRKHGNAYMESSEYAALAKRLQR